MNVLIRGTWDQQLRLAAGLVLFVFVLTHLVNHALGLISLAAMDTMQTWRWGITRSVTGGLILGAAGLVHVGLALTKLARRTTLRMPLWEAFQLLTGLAIPFLLIPHITATRVARELFGVKDYYLYELLVLWPGLGWTMAALVALVWLHACIGMHYWLRLAKGYEVVKGTLLAVAVALPLLAYLGFVSAGREVNPILQDPQRFAKARAGLNWPSGPDFDTLETISQVGKIFFYALVLLAGLVLLVRYLKRYTRRRYGLSYVHGPSIRALVGPTLLETSRMFDVPHTSVCGGRARCSTCRVRIEEGAHLLHPPGPAEKKTLLSINADSDVRLACQIRPHDPLTVFRIVKHTGRASNTNLPSAVVKAEHAGIERDLVIMFLDVRGFTRISEGKLPYDVVYILNRLFDASSQAIRAENGWIDKYLGDGLMAVFGRNTTPEQAARQALAAARQIDHALTGVNAELAEELGQPLRIGIGLHSGISVLGHIGYRDSGSLTVIGEPVNTAARLEAMTVKFECQLVASNTLLKNAGLDMSGIELHSEPVRGLSKPIQIACFKRARDLPMDASAPTETAS